MRTTVTLDSDLAAELRRIARERGISFREALNAMLRIGLSAQAGTARPYRLPARRLGLRQGIGLDEALNLASTLEDEASAGKLNPRN